MTVGFDEPSLSVTPRLDGASVGSSDDAPPGDPSLGFVLGDSDGYGPSMAMVGLGVIFLSGLSS